MFINLIINFKFKYCILTGIKVRGFITLTNNFFSFIFKLSLTWIPKESTFSKKVTEIVKILEV